MSNRVLSISKDGDSITSPDNLVQSSSTLTAKRFFLTFSSYSSIGDYILAQFLHLVCPLRKECCHQKLPLVCRSSIGLENSARLFKSQLQRLQVIPRTWWRSEMCDNCCLFVLICKKQSVVKTGSGCQADGKVLPQVRICPVAQRKVESLGTEGTNITASTAPVYCRDEGIQ